MVVFYNYIAIGLKEFFNFSKVNNIGVVNSEENFETNPIQVSKSIAIDNNDNGYAGSIGYLMYNQFVADKSNSLAEADSEVVIIKTRFRSKELIGSPLES